jgi:hypothetical protein
VETEYLWLPTTLLDRAASASSDRERPGGGDAIRGDTFRLKLDFFSEALDAAADGTAFRQFALSAIELPAGSDPGAAIWHSPWETLAFRAWSAHMTQIHEGFRR